MNIYKRNCERCGGSPDKSGKVRHASYCLRHGDSQRLRVRELRERMAARGLGLVN